MKPAEAEAPTEDSITANFIPTNFTFKRALEYEQITSQIIAEKIIHLEVCVTQAFFS